MNWKNIFVIAILLFAVNAWGQQNHYPKRKFVGIKGQEMDYYSAAQSNSQWCWAASIQMVLNYYGVDINQTEIVERAYGIDEEGDLPDWGGSKQTIHERLNDTLTDYNGDLYNISATIGLGVPTPSILIEELSKQKPVIVGYNTGMGGHIVVITAVSYIMTQGGPKIMSIIVRDPMPDAAYSMNNGRIEYPGKYFASRMNVYWLIDVEESEEVSLEINSSGISN